MNDFLTKFYPGIKKKLHKERIKRLEGLLRREKKDFKKKYTREMKIT